MLGIRADRGQGEETLIPLLQVQCRSTATRRTLTVSETRICSPEPRTSSTSLAASGDTEVGTEVTVIQATVSILRLCFLPHPPVPRPLTQSCTLHVSHGVCFRQKLQNDIPLSVQPETLFPDSGPQYWIQLNSTLDQMDLEIQTNKELNAY